MKQTWNAEQLVISNGAYGGKTVTFMNTTFEGTEKVTGKLGRVVFSTVKPRHTLMQVGDNWYTVPNVTLVEVA